MPGVGVFDVQINPQGMVVLNRKQGLAFAPSEANAAMSAVSHVLSLEGYKVYPPKIRHKPFEIVFRQAGDEVECVIRRQGEEKGGCPVTIQQADDLVRAIQAGVDKHQDEIRIRGGARKGVSSIKMPDPLIEGR